MAAIENSRGAPQALLAADHRELARTFEALLDALSAELSAEAARLLTAFDNDFAGHPPLERARVPPVLGR